MKHLIPVVLLISCGRLALSLIHADTGCFENAIEFSGLLPFFGILVLALFLCFSCLLWLLLSSGLLYPSIQDSLQSIGSSHVLSDFTWKLLIFVLIVGVSSSVLFVLVEVCFYCGLLVNFLFGLF